MEEEIKEYESLLKKFSSIHIEERDDSFLDLCHYPGERFEEICSRILAFYFQPNEKHKLRNLWIRALCEILDIECDSLFEMTTCTEEYTYGADEKNKKIDIVLKTPEHVFAIENKIQANVYNPLSVYKQHVDSAYKNLKKHFVVLTAHNITSVEECNKIKKNDFRVVLYEDLFAKVKLLLGEYISQCNQSYLIFMLDFIKTVNNRINVMSNSELNRFFIENKDKIDELNYQYNNWKNDVLQKQRRTLAEWNIVNEMNEMTSGVDKWWVWQGWDLGIHFNDKTPFKIGIESNFIETIDSEIGEFHIYITTWNLNCWQPYRDAVLNKFPNAYLDEGKDNSNNRVYLHLPVLKRNNFAEEIDYKIAVKEQLLEYYDFLKALAEEKIKA